MLSQLGGNLRTAYLFSFVSRGFVLTMGVLSLFLFFFSERQREEFTEETNYYLYQSRAKSGTVETGGLLRRCGPPNGAEGKRNEGPLINQR